MGFARAASAGSDPRFVEMVVELVAEQVDGRPVRELGTAPRAGVGCNGALCHPGCCEPAKRPGASAALLPNRGRSRGNGRLGSRHPACCQ